jgi:superoxide dismutase
VAAIATDNLVSSIDGDDMYKPYTLPDLPYDYGALEPHYSARLLKLHHDKHHAGYVTGANTTLDKLAEARISSTRRR